MPMEMWHEMAYESDEITTHHYDDINWTLLLANHSWIDNMTDIQLATYQTSKYGRQFILTILLFVSWISNGLLFIILYRNTNQRIDVVSLPLRHCHPTVTHQRNTTRSTSSLVSSHRNVTSLLDGTAVILASIASADVLLSTSSVPLHVARINYVTSTECVFSHYIIFVTSYASIYSLVIVSVLCFVSITAKWRTKSLLSVKNALIISCVTWIAFSLSNVKILIYKDIRSPALLLPLSCLATDYSTAHHHQTASTRALWLTYLTCGYLIPLTIICILLSLIICLRQKINNYHPARSLDQPEGCNEETEKGLGGNIVMLCLLLTVIRAVCWLPLHVVTFYCEQYDSDHIDSNIGTLAISLAYASTCSVTVVCCVTSRRFRHALALTLISTVRASNCQASNCRRLCCKSTSFTDLASASEADFDELNSEMSAADSSSLLQ